MDFGVCINESRRSEVFAQCRAVEAKEISTTVTFEPDTPDSNRESSELIDSRSPITILRKPVESPSFNSTTTTPIDEIDSSLTPKEAISDSFATKLSAWTVSVGRRLEFDSVSKQAISEEEILDAVYQAEVLVTKQAEEDVLCEISSIEYDLGDCATPRLVDRRLSSVADTCPRAPMKSKGKVKDFDMGIRRKLEF